MTRGTGSGPMKPPPNQKKMSTSGRGSPKTVEPPEMTSAVPAII